MTERWIRRNEPRVVSEEVDGETIMVDSESGSYYSLDGTAAIIWRRLQGPVTASQLVAAAPDHFTGDAEEVRSGVRSFLRELLDAGLLVEVDEPPEPAAAPAAAERVPFEAPTLSAYTDMQDLMLLDPVHEVRDEGWPKAGPTREAGAGIRGD